MLDELKLQDYIDMYNNLSIKAVQSESVTSYSEGQVTIGVKNVMLDPSSYVKRQKVYENDIWVDTKPLVLAFENDNEMSEKVSLDITPAKPQERKLIEFKDSSNLSLDNKGVVKSSNKHLAYILLLWTFLKTLGYITFFIGSYIAYLFTSLDEEQNVSPPDSETSPDNYEKDVSQVE